MRCSVEGLVTGAVAPGRGLDLLAALRGAGGLGAAATAAAAAAPVALLAFAAGGLPVALGLLTACHGGISDWVH